jgi:hypothetical protein
MRTTKIILFLLVALMALSCQPKKSKQTQEWQKLFFLDMKERNTISFSGGIFPPHLDTLTARASVYIGVNVIEKSTGANFGHVQTEIEATWDNKNQKYKLDDHCEGLIGWYGIFTKFNPLKDNVLSNVNGQLIIKKNAHIEEEDGEFIVSHHYELASQIVDFKQLGLDVRNLSDSTRSKVVKNYGGVTTFEMLQVFDTKTLNLIYQETNLGSTGKGFDYLSLPGFAYNNLETIAFTTIFWQNAQSNKSNNYNTTGLVYEQKDQSTPNEAGINSLRIKYQGVKMLKERLK